MSDSEIERFYWEGGRMPSDAEREIIMRRRRDKKAAEYARYHSGGMQPVETIGDKLRAAYQAGWDARGETK